MPTLTQWLDDERTAVQVHIQNRFRWDEFFAALDEVYAALDQSSHSAYIVFTFENCNWSTLPENPVYNVTQLYRHKHPCVAGLIAVPVTHRSLLAGTVSALSTYIPQLRDLIVVKSLDEALAYARAHVKRDCAYC